MDWKDFLYTLAIVVASNIAHKIWKNRLHKRYEEALAILNRVQDLHKSGELWRHHKDIPLNRQELLRYECYAYYLTGLAIIMAIGFGIHECIELINGDWLSGWSANVENYSGSARVAGQALMLIGMLKLFPFIGVLNLAGVGFNTIMWLINITPVLIKYLKTELKRK